MPKGIDIKTKRTRPDLQIENEIEVWKRKLIFFLDFRLFLGLKINIIF